MRTLLFVGLLTACPSAMSPAVREGPRGPTASEHDAAAREYEMRVGESDVRTPAADFERLAQAHRAKAASLEADYEAACAALPFEKVTSSPFRRYALGSVNTETGVLLYLRGDLEPAQLEDEIRCHRAWLMIAPRTTSEDSALDLPGLDIDVQRAPDGLHVSVSLANPRLRPELRRRLARDLEVSRIIARSE